MDAYFRLFAGIGLVGLLFTIFTLICGELGHVADAGHAGLDHLDAGHDMAGGEHGLDQHAGYDGPGWFSTRVLSIIITTFGFVAASAHFSGMSPLGSAAVGVGAGYAAGWLALGVLRFIWSQGGSSEVRTADLLDSAGEVTVAIPAAGPGQVACEVEGKRVYQVAWSADKEPIALGAPVFVREVTTEGVLVEPYPPVGQKGV